MKLYNTLTQQIETIVPLIKGQIGLYTCGPTVYDYAHIGNWFNYIRMDTLVRALVAEGLELTLVMNITDVGHLVSDADDGEDKLEKGAKRDGKTAWQVAELYTQDFLETMELLGIQKPTHIVKATDHIKEQIELIERLERKDFTYVIDDGVYYDTAKFEAYADFAHLDLDEQQAGARVSHNPQKRNASDFALWKFSPQDHKRDMEWPSPWGTGFPGWHIECSAMSMAYLGETFDIHTGGIDHIPVHHTNEIAQSQAATGKPLAAYWMHSNHVTVEGEKISKSLGNGYRVQELLQPGISAQAIRLNALESHYRSQSRFSKEGLQASANRLKHWQSVADLVWQAGDVELDSIVAIEEAATNIKQAIARDLNTPQVLSMVDELFNRLESELLNQAAVEPFKEFLEYLNAILGINLLASGDISDQQKQSVIERQAARQQQDWAASDALRDDLVQQGIAVRDTNNKTIWTRL